MQRLRQKKINEFVNTLNDRELNYTKNKIIDKIFEKEILKGNFTIRIMGKIV